MKTKIKILKNVIAIILFLVSLYISTTKSNVIAFNDTTLKNLVVKPEGINLIQDKDNKNIYRAVVENSVTAIDVIAIPNDSKATVEVIGNNNLEEGTNKIIIKVINRDKNTSEYILYVRRKSKPLSEQEIIPNIQVNSEEDTSSINTNVDISIENVEDSENERSNQEDKNIVDMQNNFNLEEQQNSQVQNKNIIIHIIVLIILLLLSIFIMIRKKGRNN